MKQVLHIFAKDVRHLRWEIAATLLLVAMYGWHEVRSWNEPRAWATGVRGVAGLFFSLPSLLGVSTVLLPLAWAILIARIVYNESLVGDRQFWVTRPYDWRQLLAAKVLFVLVFISVPAVVLQIVLLPIAGFSPVPHLAGLVGLELGTLLLLFPVLVLASITASFTQFGLGIVAVIFYLIIASFISDYIPNSSFGDYSSGITFVLALLIAVAVVLLQYARRKTLISRLALVIMALVAVGIDAVFPYEHFINKQYPIAFANTKPPVVFSLEPPKKPTDDRIAEGDRIMIFLPVAYEGISDPNIVQTQGDRIFIDGPNGFHWASNWERGGSFLFPDRKGTTVALYISRKVFDQVKDMPVNLRAQFALSQYEDRNRRDFTVPEGVFDLEGAHCMADPRTRIIQCTAALHRPSSLLLTADLSQNTCPLYNGEVRPTTHELARGYVFGGNPSWVEPGISPIDQFQLGLTDYDLADEHRPLGICPGTPVTLSNPMVVYSTQVTMSAQNVKLGDYAMRVGGTPGAHLMVAP